MRPEWTSVYLAAIVEKLHGLRQGFEGQATTPMLRIHVLSDVLAGLCAKSTILVAIVLFGAALVSCSDDEAPGTQPVEATFVDGSISANLMPPVVLPDPIGSTLTLVLRNPNTGVNFSNMNIPSADVHLDRTDEVLGEITLNTLWDGRLLAGEVDTVTVNKVPEFEKLFDPPCGEDVYLNVRILNGDGSSTFLTTDVLTFGCVF